MDSLNLPEGIEFTPLKKIPHPKGDVFHALKCTETSFKGFGEAYFTIINPYETKGWKLHKKMVLNLIVPVGSVKFKIKSERDAVPIEIEIGTNNYGRLTISPGYWVAFSCDSEVPSLILNIGSIPHDPAESENMEFP